MENCKYALDHSLPIGSIIDDYRKGLHSRNFVVSYSAAAAAAARQKIAGVVYILLEIIAKQHFLTRLGFNFFKLFTGGWQAGLHSRPPELPKLMGLKELGLEFLC